MAHNLEMKDGKASMMYVGETPWHNLGTYLGENAVTAEEAIKAAGMDWNVVTRPVFSGLGGPELMNEVDRYQAIIREDTGAVLSIMKGRYTPFQNHEAFKILDPFIGNNQAVWHTAGVLGNGETIWVLAKLPGHIEVTKGDIIDKYFLLSNSHDGTKTIQVKFSPIRVVCQNTLQAALVDISGIVNVNVRHTKNYDIKLKEGLKTLGLIEKYSKEFENTSKQMYELRMSDEEIDTYIADVLDIAKEARNKATLYNDNKQFNRVRGRIETGFGTDIANVKGSLWGAYNAITESVDHTQRKVKDKAAYMWFGAGNTLKNKAWTEAKKRIR